MKPDSTGAPMSDVLLSMANHIFAMVAAFLMAKGWDTGSLEFIQGAGMTVISFVIALWQNGWGTTLDLVQSFVRRILTIVLAFAASRGWLSSDTSAAIVNAAGTALPILWSLVFNWKHAGPSLPGTTIEDSQTE